jgi:exopolysaccharide biosynthesis polyprenyl glycosylphosphotransferase
MAPVSAPAAPPRVVALPSARPVRRAPSPAAVGAPLAARDVRLAGELAHRRLFVATVRTVARIAVLHTVDAAIALLAALAAIASPPDTGLALVAVAFALLSLNATGSYRSGNARRSITRVATAAGMASLILLLVTLPPLHAPVGIVRVLGFGLLLFVGLVVARLGIDRLVRQAYARGLGLRRAVLVGTRRDARAALRLVRSDSNGDQRVVGYVSTRRHGERGALGTLYELPEILMRADAEEVLFVSALREPELREAVEAAFEQGARCYAVPWALTAAHARAEAVKIGECPAFHLHPAEFELPELLLKRALDLVLTTLALIVVVPLGALIALAIKVDSPGPVFFRQRRVGLGGRTFVMWKFRSMRVAAHGDRGQIAHLNDYGAAPLFKLRRDPRVTRIGRLLRRTSLDELPQLINVLRGEMSLVGPRPPLPEEVARYLPHHYDRLSVVPGLTGPWQVNGRNLITDFERIVRMEREYIDAWSLRMDLQILVRTVGVVVSGTGAY